MRWRRDLRLMMGIGRSMLTERGLTPAVWYVTWRMDAAQVTRGWDLTAWGYGFGQGLFMMRRGSVQRCHDGSGEISGHSW